MSNQWTISCKNDFCQEPVIGSCFCSVWGTDQTAHKNVSLNFRNSRLDRTHAMLPAWALRDHPPRLLSFSIIAIFIGIPSGSLCGGESRTAVLQKLFNIRFSYKHCFRLPSYSARWLPKPWQGLLVFNVVQWAPTWEKFASRHHLILKFPFHYYCVHLLLFLTLIALILNRFPDENAETIKIR